MAFCRSVFFNSSLHPTPHQVLSKSTRSFLTCPFKLSKFTKLPPQHQKPYSAIIYSTLYMSSASSSMESPPPMESPPEGYRKNVGICLINPSKKIFAASRLDIPDAWQMPQVAELLCLVVLELKDHDSVDSAYVGGIDDCEDPKIAAIRELKEETGISSAEVLAEAPYWLTYDFPPKVREKLKHQWGSDWKGQAQKWFLLKFTGKEEEINLLGDGTEKPEFGEWSWMPPEQIIDHAVDFKKPVYKEALAVFAPYLQ